ncbi:MAG: hypothetical protein IRZ07_30905 [Microbispora sp.]|nr:hypothetical protein [Microbispora sp.]
MKRALLALACAASAALVAPAATPAQAQTLTQTQTFAQAQARTADPVAALRKEFAAGHGVRFVSTGTLSIAGVTAIKFSENGSYAFGRSGVIASDTTRKTKYSDLLKDEDEDLKDAEKPVRTIVIGKTGYLSGGSIASLLPEGKTWVRVPGVRPGSASDLQFVNPTDTRSLKTVLATTKAKGPGGRVNGVKTTLYRGTITLAQLTKVNPSLKSGLALLASNPGKAVVTWKLWIDANQLVRRVSASTNLKAKGKQSFTFTLSNDATYAGWGKKVTVKAPPKSKVAKLSDLNGDLSDAQNTVILPN